MFGHWVSGDHREEVVLLRAADGTLEVHCHGGSAAVARIVDGFTEADCNRITWEQWVEQAASNLITAEAEVALTRAATRRTAAILLHQQNGALARELAAGQALLVADDLSGARSSLESLIARSAVGMHLTQPWRVAIAGRPNVGKSSLMNALVGYQRAIVFDQPGTTRDVLAAETAIDGWPVRLTDAAGIRDTADPLEAEGVRLAQENLARADLVLWLLDATSLENLQDATHVADAELDQASAAMVKPKRLLVVNKIDRLVHYTPPADGGIVCTSAVTQAGLPELIDRIGRRLVPSPPSADVAVPFTQRQVERLQEALTFLTAGDVAAASDAIGQLVGPRRSSR